MAPLITYHPFKGIYVLLAASLELARMPLWVVKYVTSYGRQNPKYTFKQAFGTRFLYAFLQHVAAIQFTTPLPLTPGAEKDRFITISPASSDFYKGPLDSNPDVKPTTIGATWYPAALSASVDKRNVTVVLHMHGGAFVHGDGRTEGTGYLASQLLKHSGATHIFCPQYRLSTLPASATSNPFPAALQDTLTSYLYLLHTLQIPAANIIISGDSAGGNLILSLLRYISDHGADVGIPAAGGAFLWSPWVDLRDSTTDNFSRTNSNYSTDYLPPNFTIWGSHAYAGPAGISSLNNPYISHLGKPFKTATPIFMNTGGAEVLFFDDVKCGEEMAAVAGNRVTVDVEPDVPHDILLVTPFLGFHDAVARCAKRAGEWWKNVKTV
ncbi:alpha/beta-hydrolase [Lepidopterella palustris CBS 459.81]|uniref:Alpha/beta-hydrolase n=1 Tax=Lepidopterella palustris CBS 459.81 TaxID=1314670 RepID=A0A8E2E9N9_9PEZI|nr:alpha/beta-hydrolase [Lepidopterella palustris CBS 459.81]